MPRIALTFVFSFLCVAGCASSGNKCTTDTCSSSGPNNGQTYKTCADATVTLVSASESGSVTYGGITCKWSGTSFETQEEACLQAEEDWCSGTTPDMN